MTTMTQSQIHVGCLVARTVLGKSGKPFQREVERLIYHHGPEWVNSRLKALWTAANHLRNGDKLSAQRLYQDNSIAYHKSDMTPKGPFRPAVRGYVLARRPSVVKRYAAVLRFYTSLKLSSLSKKQSDKALTAITVQPMWKMIPTLPDEGQRVADMYLSGPLPDTLKKRLDKYFDYRPKPHEEIYADQLRATSSYYSPFSVPRELRDQPYSRMALSLCSTSYVPESINDLVPCKEMRDHLFLHGVTDNYVGKIIPLQEQGCKARVVAVPNAWVQLGFMPLHKKLAALAESSFPQASVVKDQQKAVYGVLRHMNEGKEVFCTDLSSATDKFPRSFSLRVLERLGFRSYARALEDVCRQQWESPWGPVSYGTGQPMGLYGSFPLFHFSNLMVADLAERTVESQNPVRFQNGKTFYVLGDDVVFSDRSVQDAYQRFMTKMGVPISREKSFEGNLAEFAGFVVTQTSKGASAFRPYKVPSGGEITNPISFLDSLGVKVKGLSHYWDRQWERYSATVSQRSLDLSPLVPSEDEKPVTNVYRGDNQTMLSLANVLCAKIPDLPDLSGSTKINKIPLFREQRALDHYGYNPKMMVESEKVREVPGRKTKTTLKKDPVLRKYTERESSSSGSPMPSPTKNSSPRIHAPEKGQSTCGKNGNGNESHVERVLKALVSSTEKGAGPSKKPTSKVSPSKVQKPKVKQETVKPRESFPKKEKPKRRPDGSLLSWRESWSAGSTSSREAEPDPGLSL